MMVEELMCGSCTSFNMYPALNQAPPIAIIAFGTPDQKERYAAKMFDGSWSGTMCLTGGPRHLDVGKRKTRRSSAPTATTTCAARRSSSPAAIRT